MNQHDTTLRREFGSRPTPMDQRKNVCTNIGTIQQFYKDYGMVASPRALEYLWSQYFEAIDREYYNYQQYRSNVTKWRNLARRMDLIVNG